MSTIVDPLINWHVEFAKVISCAKCSKETDRNLMRDSGEHVPQPGYIGKGYGRTGLLLVGQNPYLPNVSRAAQDREYTAALRALRDAPTDRQDRRAAARRLCLGQKDQGLLLCWPCHRAAIATSARHGFQGDYPPVVEQLIDAVENTLSAWSAIRTI